MSGVIAITILITIFALSEFVALKTKATLSTVLVFSSLLLFGFWGGLPGDIFQSSGVVVIGGNLIGVLITGMGNLLDFSELKRQWKTVIISISTVILATIGVYFIGKLIIGRDLAIAGAPIFAGSSTASIIMNARLTEVGKEHLALFVIMMLVFQNFVGIPVASQLLKKAGRNFLLKKDEHVLYENLDSGNKEITKRKLLELPKSLSYPSMILAKLCLITALAFYTSILLKGAINFIVIALVYGTIFTELGLLEKEALEKTKASGFILFSCIVILFTNLPRVKPNEVLELFIPLAVLLGIGVLGAMVSGYIMGKIFKVDPYLAICMCLTCMFGFPTTMFMSNEVAMAIGSNEKEIKLLENYLRPKMICAGFITGIFSIVLAGFVANMV